MLRITTSHSAKGAKKYFDVSLKTGDYYTRGIGTWGGKGAKILGLQGEVESVPRGTKVPHNMSVELSNQSRSEQETRR
jgi:hypothetical protein